MTALEIGARVLAARKLKLQDDPSGRTVPDDAWRRFVPHVAAIYRELEAHGFELVSDTDRKAGMFDR